MFALHTDLGVAHGVGVVLHRIPGLQSKVRTGVPDLQAGCELNAAPTTSNGTSAGQDFGAASNLLLNIGNLLAKAYVWTYDQTNFAAYRIHLAKYTAERR